MNASDATALADEAEQLRLRTPLVPQGHVLAGAEIRRAEAKPDGSRQGRKKAKAERRRVAESWR